MNNISNYIIEKLHISKGMKNDDSVEDSEFIEDILKIIEAEDDIDELAREKINLWITDNTNYLYCYVYSPYKHKHKLPNRINNIFINQLDASEITDAEKLANQSTIYKSTGYIKGINISQDYMAIYLKGVTFPICFERIGKRH